MTHDAAIALEQPPRESDVLRCRAVWFTWETQRRNFELSEAFDCVYARFDLSEKNRLGRYLDSTLLTMRTLSRHRPKIVFAQCPSVVLVALLALLKPFYGYRLIIDAHNAAFLRDTFVEKLLRIASWFAFRSAEGVIVSNPQLSGEVTALGGKPLVLADKLPDLSDGPLPDELAATVRPRLVFVTTFAVDEPIAELLEAATHVTEDYSLLVTGRKSKAGDTLRFASRKVLFTDFLPNAVFDALVRSADLIIDLTTRDDCLVCGAYESVAAGVPVLVSDSRASRETFTRGALYAANTQESYIKALNDFFAQSAQLRHEVVEFRSEFVKVWNSAFEAISAEIRAFAK